MQSQTGLEYFIDEQGRQLSIMAMSSGPVDQPYSGARSTYQTNRVVTE